MEAILYKNKAMIENQYGWTLREYGFNESGDYLWRTVGLVDSGSKAERWLYFE